MTQPLGEQAETSGEARRHPRRRTYYGGEISFSGRKLPTQCVVRDLSTGGAQIALPQEIRIPGEIELRILKTGQSYRCRVTWSRGKNHGLQFVTSDPGLGAKSASTDAAIHAVLEEARERIAEISGMRPEAVTLKIAFTD